MLCGYFWRFNSLSQTCRAGELLCGEHKHFPQGQKAPSLVLTSHHVTQRDGAGGADENIPHNPTALQSQLIMRVSFVTIKYKDPPIHATWILNIPVAWVHLWNSTPVVNPISFLKHQHFNIVYRIVERIKSGFTKSLIKLQWVHLNKDNTIYIFYF